MRHSVDAEGTGLAVCRNSILGLSCGTNLDPTYCVTSYIVITSNPLTVPQCISTLHVNWPMLSLTTSKWPKIKSFLSRFCSVFIEKRLQRIHSRWSPVRPINHPRSVQPRSQSPNIVLSSVSRFREQEDKRSPERGCCLCCWLCFLQGFFWYCRLVCL